MNRHSIHPFIFVSGLFLSVIANANPIVIPHNDLTEDLSKPAVILLLAVSFGLEIACFLRVLSQSRSHVFLRCGFSLCIWLHILHFYGGAFGWSWAKMSVRPMPLEPVNFWSC